MPRTYSGARSDIVRLLPPDPGACVLEVGCGTGATGALALARGRAVRYVGIERQELRAAEAREVLSEVLAGDVEHITLDFQPASFDALVLAGVLERLASPSSTLRKLARFVRPGGVVLATSPNASHWRVVCDLACGRIHTTADSMRSSDRGHWFTPRTFVAMFERAGFAVERLGPVEPFSESTRLVTRLTGHRIDHLFMADIGLMAIKR